MICSIALVPLYLIDESFKIAEQQSFEGIKLEPILTYFKKTASGSQKHGTSLIMWVDVPIMTLKGSINSLISF